MAFLNFLVTLPSQRQLYGSTMEMDCYHYNHLSCIILILMSN